MKIRIGLGMGPLDPADDLDAVLEALETTGVDSLWISEVVHQPHLDPVAGMGYIAGRTRRLKVGTGVMILPGRHPVLVAKQLATLGRLAPKRILPVVGLHPARPEERVYFPVEGRTGEVFDETLLILRRLLAEESVTHEGRFFTVSNASIGFVAARPLDLWLGGRAPNAMIRIGKYGDGWLGSFLTPAEAAVGIEQIKAAASDAGREIEDDHYGVSLPVAGGDLPSGIVEAIRTRRPDIDPASLVPVGWDGLARAVEEFAAVGVSKFVVRPLATPTSWISYVEEFAGKVRPLET